MGSILASLLLLQPAQAGRKSDTIRLLNLESRYEEAQGKCVKWGALERTADAELRGFCAQAHWINAETVNSIEAWQQFQEQWAGTDWAIKAFQREGKVALELLGDEAPEQAYLDLADQFHGYSVAESARVKAGTAAIRDCTTVFDAERIKAEYPEHENLSDLIVRVPGAFYKLSVLEGIISVDGNYQVNALVTQPFWAVKNSEGVVTPWVDAVRVHLEEAGVPLVFIMNGVQELPKPTVPFCPLTADDDLQLGAAMRVGDQYVFEPQDWEANCDNSSSAVMVYSNLHLVEFSLQPGHALSFKRKPGRKDFTAFVQRPGEPILFEDRIFVPIGKSFAIFPISGATPWITDQPPGAMRTKLDNTVRGTGIPKDWSIQGAEGGGVVLSNTKVSGWTLPKGELRFMSPLMKSVLGLSEIAAVNPITWEVPWEQDETGASVAPSSSMVIDHAVLTESELKPLNMHIGGAGLDTFKLALVDGFATDLDGDGVEEKILRGTYNEVEVVLVLDTDDKYGKRTWIFETAHAMEGKMAAAKPMVFEWNGQRIFAWSGIENEQPYTEVIYKNENSYSIIE